VHGNWHGGGTLAETITRRPVKRLAVSLVDRPFHSLSSKRGRERSSPGHVGCSMDGSINTLFNNVATDIRNVSVAVGVVAFMLGALQYATSGGSPHQLELGKLR
jgi:hypothetical protein